VLLFDATVATGAAATMAIRVLKDHRVEEKNIILCTLLSSKTGMSLSGPALGSLVSLVSMHQPNPTCL
jgi:uracil phosphoribosyltransferase